MKQTTIISIDEDFFDDLDVIKLDRQKFEDLPERVQNSILSGDMSPVFKAQIPSSEGGTVNEAESAFSLVRMEDGSVKVSFYPVTRPQDHTGIPAAANPKIRAGRTVLTRMASVNGRMRDVYVCLDPHTGSLVSYSVPDVERFRDGLRRFPFSDIEIAVLEAGDLVMKEDPRVGRFFVGLDLLNPKFVTLHSGSEDKWHRYIPQYDRYTFGLGGCWRTDERGTFSYVREEDYSRHPDVDKAYHDRAAQAKVQSDGAGLTL